MYYRKLLSVLPAEYSYRETGWYKKLISDMTSDKRRVLIISYLSTIFFPLSFLLIDLQKGETDYIINYTVPLIVLLIMLLYIIFIRSSKLTTNITIAVAFTGFFLAAYLPQGRQVAVFIMIVFTPFVFNLSGLVKGAIWSLIFFGIIAVCSVLSFFSIIPEWNLVFSEYHFLMISLSIVINFILVFSGQMQNEKHLENLIENLIFDITTRLPNKETMINSFPADRGFILAIVRIQNFSAISSLFGYEIGEKILLFVAKSLSSIAQRDGYSCYKLLGHEFGIIVHENSEVISDLGIENFLTLLWFELQSIKLIDREQEFCPSFRIGAAIISPEFTSNALSRADIALNMAEKYLHNTYIYNEESDDRMHVMKSSELYSTLLDNIRNNRFKIVYQPIVDTLTGSTRWYEALLRVRNKNGNYESVYNYLHVARNTGLYNQLTRFVLQKAHEFIINTGNDISINITLGDIIHPGFMEEVIRICQDIRNKKGNLIIEILESEELIEIELSRQFIKTVQDLGCKVAIDDFGSGYSNFSALLNLSIDIVKIDGLLMKSVTADKNALSMIESIAGFCHKAGKVMVAEYIEDEHMHEIALNNRIQFCQGYFFGKPESIESVI